MGRSLITRLEWPLLDMVNSQKGVRQVFCSCLDSILEGIIREAVLHSDGRSDDKTLNGDDAEKATNKYECL